MAASSFGPADEARLPNSVRIILGSSEEARRKYNLEYLTKDILAGIFGLGESHVFCLQDFSRAGFYDLTFSSLAICAKFFADFQEKRDNPLLKVLVAVPLFDNDNVMVTVHMYNPFVPVEEIATFLLCFCATVRGGGKVLNPYGMWNAKRRFFVRFKRDGAGDKVFSPAVFQIGPHRGFLFFAGQPQQCHKCGSLGHTKDECLGLCCHRCGAPGHISSVCPAPKLCSLCGADDHLYRDCQKRPRTFAEVASGGGVLAARPHGGDMLRGRPLQEQDNTAEAVDPTVVGRPGGAPCQGPGGAGGCGSDPPESGGQGPGILVSSEDDYLSRSRGGLRISNWR